MRTFRVYLKMNYMNYRVLHCLGGLAKDIFTARGGKTTTHRQLGRESGRGAVLTF